MHEPLRWSLLRSVGRWTPTLLLYTRTKHRDVLRQQNCSRIYTQITDTPGIHFRALRRNLSLSNSVLAHHLATLEQHRFIRRRRSGRRLCFYPSRASAHPPEVDSWAYQIVQYVSRQPGATQTGLARALGVSRQAVHYHVRRLQGEGLIVVERHGRASRIRLTPAAVQLRDGWVPDPVVR